MKFLRYTYKQLNLFMLLASIFIILLAYRFNISPTLNLRTECITMQSQLEKLENASIRLQQLKTEYRRLNKVSGNSNRSNDEIRQEILTYANKYAQGSAVSSFKEVHSFSANNMTVITHFLEMQGNFNDLVRIAWYFEKDFKDARLSAFKIFSLEDSRTKKLTLYGTYYFQNFKKQ